jgi:putative membrane protein
MKSCLTATTCCVVMFAAAMIVRADVNDKVREMTPPKDSKDFAMKTAECNLLEIKLAQLAQQKAQSDEVKQLAKKIEQDHQQAGDKLKTVAQGKNITLPTDLKGEAQEKYQAFQQLDGKAFDTNYVLLMTKEHLHDIMAFTNETQMGTDQDIKQWASETLPHLKQHGQQVARVASSMGIPVDVLASGGRSSEAMPAGSRQGPGGTSGTAHDAGTTGTGHTGTGTSGSGSNQSGTTGTGSGRTGSGTGTSGGTSGSGTGTGR